MNRRACERRSGPWVFPTTAASIFLGAAVALCLAAGARGAPPAPTEPWPPQAHPILGDSCSSALQGTHRTYDVGPGRRYHDLNSVPWLDLRAGDVVNIYYRPEPYRSKIGLRAQGAPSRPVVLNGVTDAQCRRPEITGAEATTPDDLARARFFSKQYSEFLGVILLYRGPNDPYGWRPSYVEIRNLRISGGHAGQRYTGQDGTTGQFENGSAGIYAVVVDHLLVENCEIDGNGNGIFVNSRSDEETSSHIIVRRNLIHDNGNPGSYYEHNLYIQAMRSLYEGNDIGQLVPGAVGSALKDRSSGTVVRYNRIVAAARALDLVEIEGGVRPVYDDPLYRHAWVYGNLIISDFDRPGASSTLLIHWGGDNDPRFFRNGTLHFYANTVVTRASRDQAYFQSIFDMPDDQQSVIASSNAFVHEGSSIMALLHRSGHLEWQDTNWLQQGWTAAAHGPGNVDRFGTLLQGADALLGASWAPRDVSPLVGRLAAGPPTAVAPAQSEQLQADLQFEPPGRLLPRAHAGAGGDLGAFDRR